MKLAAILILLACPLLSPAELHAQSWVEQFTQYHDGSDGSPVWRAAKGRWEVAERAYVESSGDGDCASFLQAYHTSSFRLEAEFELVDGDAAMGLFFSSRSTEQAAYSQMVRFDGGTTLLAGYFENGEFTAEQSVGTPVEIARHTRHSIALDVDAEHLLFSIELDGRIVLDRLPLFYRSGYCGLENGGGKVRFTKVEMTERPAVSLRPDYSWIGKIARTKGGDFLVTSAPDSTVLIVSANGSLLRRIGVPAGRGGQLTRPMGIAVADDTTLLVSDAATNRIHRFGFSGTWLGSFGRTGSGNGEFKGPAALSAMAGGGPLFVADRENGRIQVFTPAGAFLTSFGTGRLALPSDIAIDGDALAVLNTGKSRIECYRWDGKRAVPRRTISYGGGEGRGLALSGNRIYLSAVNSVTMYDTSGKKLAEFRGRAAGFLHPEGIAADRRHDLIAVGDLFRGRILLLPPDLRETSPSVTEVGMHSATVTWESPRTGVGRLWLLKGADTLSVVSEKSAGRRHTIRLDNLEAGTTYHISFTPHVATLPADESGSRAFAFTTSAGPKLKAFARLPMLAVIFTNVHDTAARPASPTPQPSLADSETVRIVRQLRDAVRFYWVHSGMRFFIDLDTLVVRDSVGRPDLFGPEWWYPPRESMLRTQLARRGKQPGDYTSFLYLSCTQKFDTTLHRWTLAGKGGAFTNGVGTGKGYGISWWDVTRANHNAGNNWLMVHEFNHQLDDIFMVSGYPEYWFNHISPTIGTAGKFGEHFDANAAIIAMTPPAEWLDLRYTMRELARDADEDGIPDNDPKLPLDEARLGSDSTSKDTDGDGVADLDELSAANWITEGWGETASSLVTTPNLRSADSDNDGIADARDPYPSWPVTPILHRMNKPDDTPPLFARLNDGRASCIIRGGWTDDSLILIFESKHILPVKLMIDGNDDGWFLGDDNLLLSVTPAPSPGGATVKLQLFNGSDPYRWPFMDDSLAATLHTSARVSPASDGTSLLRVAIPRDEQRGLAWGAGKVVGMNIGFLATVAADGSQRYIDLFEPNRLFELTLIK